MFVVSRFWWSREWVSLTLYSLSSPIMLSSMTSLLSVIISSHSHICRLILIYWRCVRHILLNTIRIAYRSVQHSRECLHTRSVLRALYSALLIFSLYHIFLCALVIPLFFITCASSVRLSYNWYRSDIMCLFAILLCCLSLLSLEL